MEQYTKLAESIIKYVGGSNNVQDLIHCVTRLRFTLIDKNKVEKEKLDNLDGVITSLSSGGQFQVVIGNQVADVYSSVIDQLDSSKTNNVNHDSMSTETEQKQGKEMSVGAKILDLVSNIFTPILPVLSAAGMIKGINVLLSYFNLYGTESSWYILFNGIGDALFLFFPIFIGYTSAIKFKLKPLVGMVIGAILCYPALNGADMNFFNFSFTVTYTSTVLPVIVLCALATPLERFFDSKLPLSIRSFISPLLVLLLVVPIGYLAIGPAVNQVALLVGNTLTSIYTFNPIIAGLVVGSLYSVLVMFGLHGPLMMLLIIDIINGNPSGLYAIISVQSFAITGTILGMWFGAKNPKKKSAALGAWVTSLFGVTEPAIYGLLLPKVKYFVVSCIASGIGGAYVAMMGIKAHQMAGMGLFRIPAFFQPNNVQYPLTHILIGYSLALIVGFVLSIIVNRKEDVNE